MLCGVTLHITGSTALNLSTWDACRRHLTPNWWTNSSKGGNEQRDFSQTYIERYSGCFQAQADALAK